MLTPDMHMKAYLFINEAVSMLLLFGTLRSFSPRDDTHDIFLRTLVMNLFLTQLVVLVAFSLSGQFLPVLVVLKPLAIAVPFLSRGTPIAELRRALGSPRTGLQLAAFFSLGTVGCLVWSLHFPVRWDSYSYQLPVAADIVKHGLFSHFEYYGFSIGSYYPVGISILWAGYLAMFGIEGSSVVNLPSLAVLSFAFFLLATRCLQIRSRLSLALVATAVCLPIVHRHWLEAYVDLYFLAFLGATAYFLGLYFRSRCLFDLLFAILSAFMLGNTKFQGVPLLGLVILATAAFGPETARFGRLRSWAVVMAWGLVFALPLGTSLFRNYRNTGNPVFPISVTLPWYGELPGHFAARELVESTSIRHAWQQLPLARIATRTYNDLGLGGLAVVVLALPLGLLLSLRRDRALRLQLAAVIGAFFALLLSFLYLPFSALGTAGNLNFSLRLGLPVVLALLLLLGVVLERTLSPRTASLLVAIVCVLNLWSIGLPGLASLLSRQTWHTIPIPLEFETRSIAYAGSNRHFHLFDEELNRDVIYVPTDRPWGRKWDWERDLSYHKRTGNFSLWLDNLRKADVGLLFFLGPGSIEEQWVLENPSLFLKVRDGLFGVRAPG